MWSYYGSKSKLVDLYPEPKYDTIIEPFAGSARYSLKYFDRNIFLIDKNIKIVKLWKWLQKCSINDILSLPILKEGENLNNFNLSDEEKLFMGFVVNDGSSSPKLTATKRAWASIPYKIKETAKILYKIKKWKIVYGNYTSIKNIKATWFIDPPYQHGGEYYPFSNKHINYNSLSIWCKSRLGQIIVCENTKANWLPFIPIKKVHGGRVFSVEAMWTNIKDMSILTNIL